MKALEKLKDEIGSMAKEFAERSTQIGNKENKCAQLRKNV